MAFMSVTDDVSHKPMSTFTRLLPSTNLDMSNNLDMSTMAATSHEWIGTGVAALSVHVANVLSFDRQSEIALFKSSRDVNGDVAPSTASVRPIASAVASAAPRRFVPRRPDPRVRLAPIARAAGRPFASRVLPRASSRARARPLSPRPRAMHSRRARVAASRRVRASISRRRRVPSESPRLARARVVVVVDGDGAVCDRARPVNG
jgi:hypothetical protein